MEMDGAEVVDGRRCDVEGAHIPYSNPFVHPFIHSSVLSFLQRNANDRRLQNQEKKEWTEWKIHSESERQTQMIGLYA